MSGEPGGKVDLTIAERRHLSARVGRIRAYLKAAVDGNDWPIVEQTLASLKAEEAALVQQTGRSDRDEVEQRLHNLERAFAAILAGMQGQAGQKHPHFEALVQDKPVRFVFGVGRDGKLTVNFVAVEAEG